MKKLLLLVIAAGLGIGFLIPSGQSAEPVAEAAVSGAGGRKTDKDGSAPVPAPTPPAAYAETQLQRRPNGHFYANALVNGQPVEFVVDTGASMVALTVADAQRIGLAVSPGDFEVIGSGASGPVRGQPVLLDLVEIDGKRVSQVRGAVLEGLEFSLLGQSYLSQITSVNMRGETMTLR